MEKIGIRGHYIDKRSLSATSNCDVPYLPQRFYPQERLSLNGGTFTWWCEDRGVLNHGSTDLFSRPGLSKRISFFRGLLLPIPRLLRRSAY